MQQTVYYQPYQWNQPLGSKKKSVKVMLTSWRLSSCWRVVGLRSQLSPPSLSFYGEGGRRIKVIYPKYYKPKSLYRSRGGNHFYRTEYEIWTGWQYWLTILKKIWGSKLWNFWGCFFNVFTKKYCSVRTKKVA